MNTLTDVVADYIKKENIDMQDITPDTLLAILREPYHITDSDFEIMYDLSPIVTKRDYSFDTNHFPVGLICLGHMKHSSEAISDSVDFMINWYTQKPSSNSKDETLGEYDHILKRCIQSRTLDVLNNLEKSIYGIAKTVKSSSVNENYPKKAKVYLNHHINNFLSQFSLYVDLAKMKMSKPY